MTDRRAAGHRGRGPVGDGARPRPRARVAAGAGGSVVAARGRGGVGVAAAVVHLALGAGPGRDGLAAAHLHRGCCGGCWCCATRCAPRRGAVPPSPAPTDARRPASAAGPTTPPATASACAATTSRKPAAGRTHRDVGAISGRAALEDTGQPRDEARSLAIRTPTGRTYQSRPPPLLGWGSDSAPGLPRHGRPVPSRMLTPGPADRDAPSGDHGLRADRSRAGGCASPADSNVSCAGTSRDRPVQRRRGRLASVG